MTTADLVRQLLAMARNDSVIYGRLLQGPPSIERLYDEDVALIVKTLEQWRASSNQLPPKEK